MSLRVTLLGVDEVRELGWVTDEEHGGVVKHPVEVALLRLDLDGETSGVTSGVRRSRLATDGGETHGDLKFCLEAVEAKND